MIYKGARIISPIDNIDEVLDIKIENGIITEIAKEIEGDGIDFSDMIIIPGLVDMHCHLREPGYEYKETIETGIQSALNGGYTAICPMANTKPVVDNTDTLKENIQKAYGIGYHQVCAVTKELEGERLVNFERLKAAGAIAFSDDGRPVENMKILKEAFQKLQLTGDLLMSHAEDSKLLTDSLSEAVSVARELEVLREVGGRLHFAHISTRRALELIREAKKEGLQVTCETAPHYFTFTKDDVTADGRFKMNPPLRTNDDLNAVIEALKDGTIDCIATDHAPHSLEEKTKPFADAPFGIVGFETALGATLKLVEKGHLTMNQVVKKLSVNPAKILGLKGQGEIKVGQKANLAVVDPNIKYKVNAANFKSKCKISPFESMEFKGKVRIVISDGKLKDTTGG